MLLDATTDLLLVVDVQERLAPAIADSAAILDRIALLGAAARELPVPVIVSEQYPKGLGPTVAALDAVLAGAVRLPKLAFSCGGDEAIMAAIRHTGRRRVVLCGMEAHVCVLQSAFGLAAQDFATAVVADASGSRRTSDRDAGLARLARGGCQIVTAEMVVFEWLGRAGTPAFRALSPLLKG